jgi:hypothetical protein
MFATDTEIQPVVFLNKEFSLTADVLRRLYRSFGCKLVALPVRRVLRPFSGGRSQRTRRVVRRASARASGEPHEPSPPLGGYQDRTATGRSPSGHDVLAVRPPRPGQSPVAFGPCLPRWGALLRTADPNAPSGRLLSAVRTSRPDHRAIALGPVPQRRGDLIERAENIPPPGLSQSARSFLPPTATAPAPFGPMKPRRGRSLRGGPMIDRLRASCRSAFPDQPPRDGFALTGRRTLR